MAARAGAKITELKGSHVVFMSQPQAVAKIIEEVVIRVGNEAVVA